MVYETMFKVTAREIMVMKILGNINFPSTKPISQEFKNLLTKMCHKDNKKRPFVKDILADPDYQKLQKKFDIKAKSIQ